MDPNRREHKNEAVSQASVGGVDSNVAHSANTLPLGGSRAILMQQMSNASQSAPLLNPGQLPSSSCDNGVPDAKRSKLDPHS